MGPETNLGGRREEEEGGTQKKEGRDLHVSRRGHVVMALSFEVPERQL